MAVIGIDLGTTNSLVSVWQDGKAVLIPNSLGEFLTPSAVGVDEEDNLIVGKIAKERLISHSAHTTASFKCFMGTDKMISLGERRFSSAELSSFILRQLKKDAEIYLGEPVSEAVISVPAYFDDNGRNATKLAGELAGLKVERIINEPSAAALAYKINREEEAAFLVFDFGGGTLDISIVDMFDSVIDIIAVAGDNHLGGDDFNMAIALYFCNENKLEFSELPESVKAVLLKQSEQCKIALSTQKTAAIIVNADQKNYSLVLDNQKLLEITAPLFERIRKPLVKALNDADMSASEIDEVILVGGSSHMLLVRRYLENLFHRNIDVSISPDTAVAEGVAVAAGIKERREDIRDVVLTDICPFTLGIGLHNEAQEDNLRFFPMIERNSTLPSSYEHKFCTVCDNQTSIRISIAQGEKPYFKSNLFLGELEMEVPPAPRGQEAVNVRFTYDINGILQVDVQSLSTGLKKSKLIVNKNARLTDEELARRVSQLEKLKIHPRELDENKLLIARAESIYEQSLGADREYIETALNRFILILERQKPGKIRRAQKQFSDFLDSMEMGSMRNPFDFYDDSDDEEE